MSKRPSLSQLLLESARNVEAERAHKAQAERITRDVKSRLKHVHASDDDDLVCPSCGYKGPEADFEPDTDDESDGYRTDDVTSDSDSNNDEDNVGDRPAEYDNRRMSGLSRDQVIASLNKIRC